MRINKRIKKKKGPSAWAGREEGKGGGCGRRGPPGAAPHRLGPIDCRVAARRSTLILQSITAQLWSHQESRLDLAAEKSLSMEKVTQP